MSDPQRFDDLIRQAQSQSFIGWDFSWLTGRMTVAKPSWDFAELARHDIAGVSSMLDLGTGGGEFLASLAPLPARSVATETYPPNVPIARQRLMPLGVEVIEPANDRELPFADASFDFLLDRHEAFDANEAARVLKPGGVFLTQQVGGAHFAELNEAIGAPPYPYRDFTLETVKASLRSAPFRIVTEKEEYPAGEFRDVGAIVYYLRATPWQVPEFSVESYRARLLRLHEHIEREGSLHVRTDFILIRAIKI